MNEMNYDQFIRIDLLNLTKITGIATQGREHLKGREYARDYKISYSRDGGVWDFYGKKMKVKACEGKFDRNFAMKRLTTAFNKMLKILFY